MRAGHSIGNGSVDLVQTRLSNGRERAACIVTRSEGFSRTHPNSTGWLTGLSSFLRWADWFGKDAQVVKPAERDAHGG